MQGDLTDGTGGGITMSRPKNTAAPHPHVLLLHRHRCNGSCSTAAGEGYPSVSDAIQDTDDQLVTGHNKSIIGFQKIQVS